MLMQTVTVVDRLVLEWHCHSRAHCCQGWRVDVPPATLRAMAERCSDVGNLDAVVRLLGQHPEQRRLEGICALPMNDDGACMFLDADNRCAYRSKHGDETLPDSCLKFPYLGLLTPRRRLLGLSFTCPTALDLFAGQKRLELIDDLRDPVPTEYCCDFLGDSEPREDSPATVFWDVHWEWFRQFRQLSGTPAQRLRALAQQVAPVELPTTQVAADFWQAERFGVEQATPLLRQGAAPEVLEAVFDDHAKRIELPYEEEDLGADDALNRYLEHRLLVPEFLITGASLARLLGVLFAILARFRRERARGKGVLASIMHLDRLLLHSDFIPQLFPADVDEPQAWQSLAMIALSDTAKP